jgi:hypothetical protein
MFARRRRGQYSQIWESQRAAILSCVGVSYCEELVERRGHWQT